MSTSFTKTIMAASGVLLALTGVILTFLNIELAKNFGFDHPALSGILLQIMGALYFGFGMLNWMAKGAIIGGIYNKPIAIANFSHFFMSTMAIGQYIKRSEQIDSLFYVLLSFSTLFLILFGLILFNNPRKS